MNDTVVRYDESGVLLRYHPDKLGPHHVSQEPQPSDRERCALVAADQELRTLFIIAQYLEVSDAGFSRILYALQVIQRALDAKRSRLGRARDHVPPTRIIAERAG